MTTPFILGNDFADQYCLSIVRSEDATYIEFGASKRRSLVQNSVGPSLVDESGKCFSVAAVGLREDERGAHPSSSPQATTREA